MPITSPNIDRFSKIFHQQTHSTDLNPTDYKNLAHNSSTTIQEKVQDVIHMVQCLINVWVGVQHSVIDDVINQMRRRLHSCLEDILNIQCDIKKFKLSLNVLLNKTLLYVYC